MAKTKTMQADEIIAAFNSVTERQYWKASLAGTRLNPEVHFNSRSTMVCIAYRVASGDFTVTFSKASAAWGDFMASAYNALAQVLACLKAGGLPVSAALDTAHSELRVQYDPRSRVGLVMVADHGDDWQTVEPLGFKVPVREPPAPENTSQQPLDDAEDAG